jgi:hypothetical protein
MPKLERRVLVYMDEKLADWLEGKALEGYKKAAFVRRLMELQRSLETKGVA